MLAAELVGTLVLVLFGCGAAVLGGFDHVGQLGIALAFGFAIVAMAYGIGPVSGCHVNPAVSLGAFVAGRMSAKDMIVYWIAQFIGAIIGAAILGMIAKTGFASLGQNGFDAGSPGGYGLHAALVFEIVATEKQVIGSLAYAGEFADVIALIADGRMDVTPLITGRIGLDNILEQGFEELANHKDRNVKIIVSPSALAG